MGLHPLADRVIVEPMSAEEMTKGGIFLPDTAKEKPQKGKIYAVGKGKMMDNGQVQPLELKAGDVVLYGKYSGTEVKLDGKDLLIMREDEVLAVER